MFRSLITIACFYWIWSFNSISSALTSVPTNHTNSAEMNGTTDTKSNSHEQRFKEVQRRDFLPMIYVRGSYYDIGFDVGHTFSNMIHSALNNIRELNEEFIPMYETAEGRQIYEDSLAAVQKAYPQYIRELQGMADGSKAPFYKLFLLHLDQILPSFINATNKISSDGEGCSTVILNMPDQMLIGHNEDGYTEYFHNVFILKATITEVEPNEEFTAFCYAGLLPGYAMGMTPYFAYSANILGAKNLGKGKIPRTFATRAMLAADSLEKIEDVLAKRSGGVADAMSINLILFQENKDPLLYNIEASPSNPPSDQASIDTVKVKRGEYLFHTNRFLRLDIPEDNEKLIKSSLSREATQEKLPEPKNKLDVINLLGDTSSKTKQIFRSGIGEPTTTLATAVFNVNTNSWSIFRDNPKTSDPIAEIPFYKR